MPSGRMAGPNDEVAGMLTLAVWDVVDREGLSYGLLGRWIEPLRPEAQVSVGPTQHVEQIAVLRPESAADRGRGFASGNPVALLASLSVAERSDPDWICVALPAYGKPTSACLETGPRCRCPN